MGSKNRIAKEILPIILKDRKENQYYVEPFCGGLGTFDKVTGLRIANDKNKYLIAMWKGLQANTIRPYEITKELYSKARTEFNNGTNFEFSDFEIGWIGFMGSFNGRFFDGGYSGKYPNDRINKNGTIRDYIDEQIRNTEKQIPLLHGAEFYSFDYQKLVYPKNSIIYCDIPYKNTKQYSTSKDFNHDNFWNWCVEKDKEGHIVFISEYNAPDNFECVWSGKINSYMKAGRSEIVTEKLFKIRK